MHYPYKYSTDNDKISGDFRMGRQSRRTKAIKTAWRNSNGTFDSADSDDDMDIELEFVDDIADHVIAYSFPAVVSMKRGPYTDNAARTKRRKVAEQNHCLSVCPM